MLDTGSVQYTVLAFGDQILQTKGLQVHGQIEFGLQRY